MGRAGRYTLSVMAWVAAYAGWSSLIGLVVAAITGDEARNVSAGWSALLTVLGPSVPTLVALWFNDWARDGFPTREQQHAARAVAPAEVPVAPDRPVVVEPAPVPAVPPPAAVADVVRAHPLGVPERVAADGPAGAFPVAPLLRDRD